jgi:hypothetical protein
MKVEIIRGYKTDLDVKNLQNIVQHKRLKELGLLVPLRNYLETAYPKLKYKFAKHNDCLRILGNRFKFLRYEFSLWKVSTNCVIKIKKSANGYRVIIQNPVYENMISDIERKIYQLASEEE